MPAKVAQQKTAFYKQEIQQAQLAFCRGLGLGKSKHVYKATPWKEKKIILVQINCEEEAEWCAKAIYPVKQGQWMNLKG